MCACVWGVFVCANRRRNNSAAASSSLCGCRKGCPARAIQRCCFFLHPGAALYIFLPAAPFPSLLAYFYNSPRRISKSNSQFTISPSTATLTSRRVVKRPPMTAKLLGKPPFRFLHDTLTEVEGVGVGGSFPARVFHFRLVLPLLP